MNPHRPITSKECYRAADRLMGAPPRTKLRDTDRTTYLPTWAAYRCADHRLSLIELGGWIYGTYSTATSRIYAVDNGASNDDKEAARRCIREEVLRNREGKRGSMPRELLDRLRQVAGAEARTWRERRSRLSPEWVRAIRCISVKGSTLAALCGVPHSQISMVRSRKIWGWVDDLPERDA